MKAMRNLLRHKLLATSEVPVLLRMHAGYCKL